MKNSQLKIFTFLLCLWFIQPAEAQTAYSKIKLDANELLVKAKEQMTKQDFNAAHKTFKEMLELKTVLPTEMCYFFANTLFHLGQYDNSLRFVEKYEKIAGAAGDYYKENLQLKTLLNEKMEVIRACSYCDSLGYLLEECHYCDGEGETLQSCMKCLGHKEIKCLQCSGEGVVIKTNRFGQKNYQTCLSCEGTGIQKCPHCEGKGTLTQNCLHCNGDGKVRTNHLCTHPAEAN